MTGPSAYDVRDRHHRRPRHRTHNRRVDHHLGQPQMTTIAIAAITWLTTCAIWGALTLATIIREAINQAAHDET